MTEPKKTPVYVTQPLLPPLQEFIPYLQQIWDSIILNGSGPLHRLGELIATGKHIGRFTSRE